MLSSNPSVRWRLLPLACAAVLYCGAAAAEISDTIHPFVAIGYTYDDNLLRLPDNYPGAQQRSDRTTQTQAGVIVDRPIGRQRITATAKVSRATFEHFDQLDYNGKDIKADWAWQLGNRLSGNIGGNYIESLTPFSDYITSERNLRTTRRQYANGAWRFHPSWQARAGFSRSKYDYELQVQKVNNRTEDMAEVGGDYLAASGSRVGLVARHLKGNYLNPRVFGGFALDDNYTQDELKLNVVWYFSGITTVQVLAGYAKRKHESSEFRDTGGANGRASVNWAPLGKVRFTGEVWREFAAVESLVISNSLNKGGSIGALWDATAKIQVNANVRRENREFERFASAGVSGDATDRLTSGQLGVTYAPTRATQLSLSAFREKRAGSPLIGTSAYKANGMSFNASVQF